MRPNDAPIHAIVVQMLRSRCGHASYCARIMDSEDFPRLILGSFLISGLCCQTLLTSLCVSPSYGEAGPGVRALDYLQWGSGRL